MELTDLWTIIEPLLEEERRPDGRGRPWRDARAVTARSVMHGSLLDGAFIGVVGGSLIFTLGHGINNVFPAALITGLIAAEVFRRSGSVWPAVVNLPTIPVMVLAGAG